MDEGRGAGPRSSLGNGSVPQQAGARRPVLWLGLQPGRKPQVEVRTTDAPENMWGDGDCFGPQEQEPAPCPGVPSSVSSSGSHSKTKQ